MVRIFAGYIIEQDELVRLLEAQGCGPEPGEEFTVPDAWMNFLAWRVSMKGNSKISLPLVECEHTPFLPQDAGVQFPLQTCIT